jgi:hypothetical protein
MCALSCIISKSCMCFHDLRSIACDHIYTHSPTLSHARAHTHKLRTPHMHTIWVTCVCVSVCVCVCVRACVCVCVSNALLSNTFGLSSAKLRSTDSANPRAVLSLACPRVGVYSCHIDGKVCHGTPCSRAISLNTARTELSCSGPTRLLSKDL